jgi:esterase
MAEDLIGLLDSRDIEYASLVGHSLGGKVAMWLALNWPERVEALAVVDIAPVTYASRFRRLIAALRALNLARRSIRAARPTPASPPPSPTP